MCMDEKKIQPNSVIWHLLFVLVIVGSVRKLALTVKTGVFAARLCKYTVVGVGYKLMLRIAQNTFAH